MRVRLITTTNTVIVEVNTPRSGNVPGHTVFGVFRGFDVSFHEAESGISPEIDQPLCLPVLGRRDWQGRHQGFDRIAVGYPNFISVIQRISGQSVEIQMTVAYSQRLQQRLERLHTTSALV